MWLSGGVRPSLAQGQRRVTIRFSHSAGCAKLHTRGRVEEPDGLGVDVAPAQAGGSTRGHETWGLSCTFVLSLVARRTSKTGVIPSVVEYIQYGRRPLPVGVSVPVLSIGLACGLICRGYSPQGPYPVSCSHSAGLYADPGLCIFALDFAFKKYHLLFNDFSTAVLAVQLDSST